MPLQLRSPGHDEAAAGLPAPLSERLEHVDCLETVSADCVAIPAAASRHHARLSPRASRYDRPPTLRCKCAAFIVSESANGSCASTWNNFWLRFIYRTCSRRLAQLTSAPRAEHAWRSPLPCSRSRKVFIRRGNAVNSFDLHEHNVGARQECLLPMYGRAFRGISKRAKAIGTSAKAGGTCAAHRTGRR